MKRQYTVSDKVLAANRRNLVKANAVPKSIRFRATARRLASCHANLQKAQAAQRDPQHPRRRGPMAHGFHVVDLRRTALQAGERQEDLDRHRALFLETFGGSRNQSRLASALADIFWRRWRALAWEAECEMKQFYSRLAQDVDPLLGSALRPACRQGRPRASRRQAGRRAELQVSRALDCLVILAGLGDLSDRLGELNRRFERLARTWMGLHTDDPVSFPFGSQPSLSPVEWGYWKQSPEALSTPFLSSGEVAKRLEQSRLRETPRALDPPDQWRPWGTARRPTCRLKALGRKAKDSGPQDGARERDYDLSPVTCDLDLPADFEAHRQRLEAAFRGSTELSSNLPAGQAGSALRQAQGGERSRTAAFLERAAQLSWQRLKLIDEHLEKERAAVASLFAAGLEPGELAGRLVVLLAGDAELMQQAHALERELQQALYEWLKQQEPAECCEALRPETEQPSSADSILEEIEEMDETQGRSGLLQFDMHWELEHFIQELDREFGWERSDSPPGEGEVDTGWEQGPKFSDFEF
jgi:hypothetical protein